MTSFGSPPPGGPQQGWRPQGQFAQGPQQPPLRTQYAVHTGIPSTSYETASVAAFLLALCSLFIPILPSLVALPLAGGGKRNIKASNGARRGNGFVLAARILSLVTLLFWLLIVAILLLVAFT